MAAHNRYSPRENSLQMQDFEDGDSSAGESGSDQLLDHNGSQASRGPKRKRPLMVSCELCKQRKVKCDRAQPSCGWCSRNGQTCEYKERKKPGLRAGYGKELERRLDRLEEIVQAQARLIETHVIQQTQQSVGSYKPQALGVLSYGSPSDYSNAAGPSPHASSHRGELAAQPTSQAQRGSEVATNQHDMSIRSPSDASVKLAHQARLANGLTHATPLSQVADGSNSDYAHNGSSFNIPVSLFNNQDQSLADPELDLPPYDLLYALVDLYFEHVNSWCPILHRRTTLDTLFGPSPLEEADRVVLHAIVATTLRFSADTRLNDTTRKRYYNSSKQKVILYGLENSSVKSVQALVILALDFVGSSNGPPGGKLLALIARSLVQLGLAAESGSSLVSSVYPSIYTLRANVLPDPESWIEDESRRRLFWMAYLLDRYSTIATAFDFALDEKDIDRKLPCREEFFIRNQPVDTRWFRVTIDRADYAKYSENVGSFGFYIEVLGILSRIHQFLKRPVDIGALSDVEEWQATYRKLDNELSAWEYSLPTEYAYENSSSLLQNSKSRRKLQCDWVMLHVTYQTTVIRLHSSAAYPTTRSPIFTPSYSASQRCLVAVDNILALTRFAVENGMVDRLGPPFAFSLWVSARLLLVHGSTIAHTLSPDIYLFVETLARMGRYWKVAERYSTILKRVLDEYIEHEQTGGAEGDRVTPSTVKILADMRRCAFDLDFLISRQPRHNSTNNKQHNGHPTAVPASTSKELSDNDLEYLDVFGFFNVPRVPNIPTPLPTMGINEISNPMSIHGLTSAASSNEFNITNYLIPTPETDWLFPQS